MYVQCYYVIMKKASFKNIVWKEGKHYVAQSLNIDVSSFGATKREAIANLHEAMMLYLEDAKASDITKIERPEIIATVMSYA